jgi:hypothetical protein
MLMMYMTLRTNWNYEVYREYDSEVESGGQTTNNTVDDVRRPAIRWVS